MRSFIFYLPILYTYITRLRTPLKCFSWSCIYVIPIICLLFLQNAQWNISIMNILFTLLVIVTVYNFYEIGYIQNDTETIKNEHKPTARLSAEMLGYYERHKELIYLQRMVQGLLLIFSLWLLKAELTGCILFLFAMVLLLLVYQFYNHIRGHWNMILYFMLVSIRYCSPLLLFSDNLSWSLFVLALMVFPVIKTTVFRSTKPTEITTNIYFRRYIIKFDKNRITGYRVMAYAFLSLIAFFFYWISFFSFMDVCLILYMFLFRCSLYLLIKSGFVFHEYLKN